MKYSEGTRRLVDFRKQIAAARGEGAREWRPRFDYA